MTKYFDNMTVDDAIHTWSKTFEWNDALGNNMAGHRIHNNESYKRQLWVYHLETNNWVIKLYHT